LETFAKSKNLNPEIENEITLKKNEKNIKNFSLIEIKNFLKNPDLQKSEIEKLVSPTPKISERDLNSAEKLFE
jgi:predicted ester cyclase